MPKTLKEYKNSFRRKNGQRKFTVPDFIWELRNMKREDGKEITDQLIRDWLKDEGLKIKGPKGKRVIYRERILASE